MRIRTRARFILTGLVVIAAVFAVPNALAKPHPIPVQLLAINDFHGHLQANTPGTIRVSTTQTVPAGGAAYLAAHIKALRTANTNTITVGAGDLIGASPLSSALFHDEPAIEAMNKIGLDVSAVGNHEFDEGYSELLRMQNGGCHPVDGCQDGDPFPGAFFQYLAANVYYAGKNRTLLPEYWIKKVDGVSVVFIGLTLEGTPTIVTPAGVSGLQFKDEIETVNKLVTDLTRKRKLHSFVVLIHEGGQQNAPFAGGFEDINRCDNFTGAIVDIVNGLSPEVDVVVSGHTHRPYVCTIADKLVTGASSFGRVVTDIDLTIDSASRDVTSKTAVNRIVTQDVAPDPDVDALVTKYVNLSAPIGNRVIGSITADITRTATPAGESALGDVVADSQLAATAPSDFGSSVIAFMNPGGLRVDLLYSQVSGGELPGEVTYSELFNVQPFGNSLVVKTCTGAQIDALLEQQFNNPTPGATRFLQVSNGFTYTWDNAAPVGSKIDPSTIQLNGVTLDPNTGYRVTMNSFLATGGDNFTVFNQCTDALGGEIDLDAAGRYIGANSPLAPTPRDRINRVN
ncbi:MAG: bifunctional metallophosphatase/5'-nucleotidase [Gaiellales bacterium]